MGNHASSCLPVSPEAMKKELEPQPNESNAADTKKFAECSLHDIRVIEQDQRLLTFKCIAAKISFSAGQHLMLRYVRDGRNANKLSEEELNEEPFPCIFSVASSPKQLPFITLLVEKDENENSSKYHVYRNCYTKDESVNRSLKIYVERDGYGTASFVPRMLLSPFGRGGVCIISSGTAVVASMSIWDEVLSDVRSNEIPSIHWLHSYRCDVEQYQSIPFYSTLMEYRRAIRAKHPAISTKVVYACTASATGDEFGDGSTDSLEVDENVQVIGHRIDEEVLKQFVSGIRLFYIFGRGRFVQSISDILTRFGVFAGNIRSDYTVRIDPSRTITAAVKPRISQQNSRSMHLTRLKSIQRLNSLGLGVHIKPRMDYDFDEQFEKRYIKTNGIDLLFDALSDELEREKPKEALTYLKNRLVELEANLPAITNADALSPTFWQNYWESDQVSWQSPFISPWLIKYRQEFFGHDNDKESEQKTVFVPLSGKTLDMKKLLEWGYRVIGCDCSGLSCIDFFIEHKIQREAVKIADNVICHRSVNSKYALQLYEGDIFQLTESMIGGKVDYILDRAALVALHPSIIESKYLPFLLSILKPTGRMLLASLSQLPTESAPPHVWRKEQMERLLAKFFSSVVFKEDHAYQLNAGVVVEPIYILQDLRQDI